MLGNFNFFYIFYFCMLPRLDVKWKFPLVAFIKDVKQKSYIICSWIEALLVPSYELDKVA